MSYLKLLPDEQPCPDCMDGDMCPRYACSTCGDERVVSAEEVEEDA